jgi:hypothetical protein
MAKRAEPTSGRDDQRETPGWRDSEPHTKRACHDGSIQRGEGAAGGSVAPPGAPDRGGNVTRADGGGCQTTMEGGRRRQLCDLTRIVLDVVLPTVDGEHDDRGGRFLSHVDELAFAEVVFPFATRSVQERWFCSFDSYALACCAAGAKRLLCCALAGRPSLSAEERKALVRRCAFRALCAGSSRGLSFARVDDVLQFGECSETCPTVRLISFGNCSAVGHACTRAPTGGCAHRCTSEAAELYASLTSEPADVAVRTLRLLCSHVAGDPTQRVVRELLRRGLTTLAASTLAAMHGDDPYAFGTSAWRAIASEHGRTGSIPAGTSRRFVLDCHALGMTKKAFISCARSDATEHLPYVSAFCRYGFAEDADLGWIADAAIERSKEHHYHWGWEPSLFDIACWSDDADTIAKALERGPLVSDAEYEQCFRQALGRGDVHTLEFLSIGRGGRTARTEESVANALLSLGHGDPTPVPTIEWCLRTFGADAAPPSQRLFTLTKDSVAHPRFPAVLRQLIDRSFCTRETLDNFAHDVFVEYTRNEPIRWTVELMQWLADALGTPGDSLFQVGLIGRRSVFTEDTAAFYRSVAARRPDWFDVQQVAALLANGEVEAVDALVPSCRRLVDDVAREFAACKHWSDETKTSTDLEHIFLTNTASGTNCGTHTLGVDYPRTIRWLELRGHPIASIADSVVLDIVCDYPTRRRVTLRDVVACVDRLKSRIADVPAKTVVDWSLALCNLSSAGFPVVARELAARLGVAPCPAHESLVQNK